MENKYKIKKVVLIALIIIVIGVIVLCISPKKEKIIVPDENTATNIDEQKPINLCYYRGDKTTSGYYDIAWLKLNILGEKITGEFDNLPAEKDSKVGTFEGTVGPLIPEIMGRRASVWWNSLAEGMQVKEELAIEFGEGSATVGFGEMIDRGDGVYIYKDKENLTYIKQMDQIDCETLDEKLFVEKYIKDNIVTIATDKAVLGGTWYVVSVVVNPIAHTGEVTYEDGHIQSTANFIYAYSDNPQSVVVTKFEVKG
jgi:hypothetical protein